jgi:hypothetical protein
VWNWPVLPVIPCVITLEFLSTRMLIRFPRYYGTRSGQPS